MIFLRDNVDLVAASVWAVGSASVRVILTGPVVRPYLFYMTSFFPFFFYKSDPTAVHQRPCTMLNRSIIAGHLRST